MTPKLSPQTRELVEKLFHPRKVDEVARWLEDECGNKLPFCDDDDEYGMERIRFAALKLSQGNMQLLREASDLARMDWRDLLMAAEFGYDVKAHEKWAQEILEK